MATPNAENSLPGSFLLSSNNLSDLSSVPNALLNLGLGPTVVNYIKVAMTLAQFQGMYAAPFQLIAAPGANKLIVVNRLLIAQTYGSAQLTTGGVVSAQYDSTVHAGGVLATTTQQASDFTGASASTSYVFEGASGNGSQAAFASSVNKGLFLSNDTAAFAVGTASTFNVHVWYQVIPTV